MLNPNIVKDRLTWNLEFIHSDKFAIETLHDDKLHRIYGNNSDVASYIHELTHAYLAENYSSVFSTPLFIDYNYHEDIYRPLNCAIDWFVNLKMIEIYGNDLEDEFMDCAKEILSYYNERKSIEIECTAGLFVSCALLYNNELSYTPNLKKFVQSYDTQELKSHSVVRVANNLIEACSLPFYLDIDPKSDHLFVIRI